MYLNITVAVLYCCPIGESDGILVSQNGYLPHKVYLNRPYKTLKHAPKQNNIIETAHINHDGVVSLSLSLFVQYEHVFTLFLVLSGKKIHPMA